MSAPRYPAFQDARLDALVAEALTNNLALRQAAARVETARQIVVVGGSQLQEAHTNE